MLFQFSPFFLLYPVAGLITGGITIYAIRQWQKAGPTKTVTYFITLMGSATLWCLCRFLQQLFVSEPISFLFSTLVWVGWGGSTGSLLFFSLAYTGRGDLLHRRTVALLVFPLAAGIVMTATNPIHNLFGTAEYVYWEQYDLWLYSNHLSTAYFIYTAYPQGLTVYGVYRLLRSAVGSANLYGKQAIAVAVGALAPLVLGSLFTFGYVPFFPVYVDITLLGFAVSGLCFGHAMFNYGLLELVPIARRTAWDELQDAVITLDGQDRVLDANVTARELFDVDGEYVGMAAGEFFDQVPQKMLEQYEETLDVDTQVTLRLDGESRHFSLSMSPIEGDPNGQSGRVIVLRDITSLKRRQEELELLRQVQSRVLRHNIRNEMTTIRGNAELLAERNGYGDRLVDVVRASEDLLSISRKARLVEEVVDSDSSIVECDLREIIEERAASVKAEYPETEVIIEGPETCPVEAAPRLEVAIENLIENAAEHNDGAAPQVSILLESDETTQLTIADNGPGIPEAEISVIEDERETALEHGSGIGLWLVKWILERSEAQLAFETSEEGTSVTLQFGVDAEKTGRPERQTISDSPKVAGGAT